MILFFVLFVLCSDLRFIIAKSVPVAQLDRASVSEAEGPEFESRRARFSAFPLIESVCYGRVF